MNKKDETLIKGLGITRGQLKNYLSKREEEGQRPSILKELYDRDDLSLITETHARMIVPKVRMRVLLAAMDPKRTKSLIQVFLEEYNKEMVSYERKGRLELLGGLQALAEASEEERAIGLGR